MSILALLLTIGMGVAFGQEGPAPTDDKYLLTFISWLPMIVLIGIWVFFMKRSGIGSMAKLRERSMSHMEAVEKKLDRIADILEQRSR